MLSRFRQLLENLGVNASEFASRLGIQRSSVSHVLSGRNKPSIDFLEKLLNAYPNINAAWLITGQGQWEIQKGQLADSPAGERKEQEVNFSSPEPIKVIEQEIDGSPGDTAGRNKIQPAYHEDKPVDHIIIVYQDKTFRILNQRAD